MNLKVTKYELIISNQSEMADDHLPGGAPGAPPILIRVNPTCEVQDIENGVFQNAPFANAPFANGRFPNGEYNCLWA